MALRITARSGGAHGSGLGGGGPDCSEERDRGKRILKADKKFFTDFRAKKLETNSDPNPRARRPPLVPTPHPPLVPTPRAPLVPAPIAGYATAAARATNELPGCHRTRRLIPESLTFLEAGLQKAINQAQSSTGCLQTTMDKLHQQLQQSNHEMKKWKGECSRMMKEVESWKAECEALEEKVEASVMQLESEAVKRGKMEQDKETLEREASALKSTLQECHNELSTWKEDCIFYAMRFMNWGPTLLKWGPALQRELKLKTLCLQKRKKSTSAENSMTLRAKAGQLQE